jgi:hypothetical protein
MSRTPTPSEPSRKLRRSHDEVIAETASVYVPAPSPREPAERRWLWFLAGFLGVLAIAAVGVMVAWPRLNPLRLDPVERVADSYLKALVGQDAEAARRLGTVEEPPAIRSVGTIARDRSRDRGLKGSFAPLGEFHSKIDAEFTYDPSAGRFTPKNLLGAAGETLDALHAAKEDAEKSGLYKKMQSGNPDDLFDAAEQYLKVFGKLADGALAPKRILPTYAMLVESAKPPLTRDAKALALEVAGSLKDWDALLKRSFHTLKADGPFIYERAEVTATVTDRLASLGDPPSRLRLALVRFRLEGIDTGWKVVSVKRVVPGVVENEVGSAASASPSRRETESSSPGEVPRSLGEARQPH